MEYYLAVKRNVVTDMGNDKDKHAQCGKPVTKGRIPWDSICMKFWKRQMHRDRFVGELRGECGVTVSEYGVSFWG